MDSSVVPAELWSSSPNFKWSYDVFLSFRGVDTRSNFTSHLDMALRQKGINFFIDDKLDRGGQISESLLKSIEGSRISIIIFSENYASSTWCLDELVKIIECKKSKGQIVLPVFYKVHPSDVRKQTGRFGEALAKHEAKFMTKIQTWKKALTIAAGLSGWDLGTRKEADLIQDLVKEVLSKVDRTQLLHVAKHPIGIDSQLRAMELDSDVVCDGVYMVGIHGMGGIGKTTLAKGLYNKIANHFEGCSFLSSVREASEPRNGLVQLQEQLLYEILKNKEKVDNVDRGINMIRNRLCSKKVLIVLDDVDKLDQLEKLVGGRDWFGRGSKIIVTTRKKHLLSSHGFDKMHDIQGLDQDKALELFSWHAFKESCPPSNYLDLSKRATSYCKGLPLALVVLGSFLCNRDQSKWRSILEEFKNSLTKDIKDILQISFDGLEDKVKDIFLDISCFFVGVDVDHIKDTLKACYLNPDYGITILMDHSLLTIENGRLKMHDLIRQMGQTIVHCESSDQPEKRSRLWVAKEVINMLQENSGTDAVKAIILDLAFKESVQIDPKAFRNMKNLRLLILRNITCSSNIFECLPNKLKWIECSRLRIGFLSLTLRFRVNDQLVGLDMKNSNVKHLGNIFENCKSLKQVDLSNCTYLKEIPDVTAALNLEKLHLGRCKSLKMIHESVASLSKLITLDLGGCVSLKKLPSYFMLKSLEVLNLSRCIKLQEIPDVTAALNLEKLHLGGCKSLKVIHESVASLSKLITLDLGGCVNLEKLPSYFMLKSLEVLNLSGCIKLQEIPDLSVASNLKKLDLRECTNLRIIHESVGRSLDNLITLDLNCCYKLERLPSYVISESLELLDLTHCTNLEKLPSYLRLKSLVSLSLIDCKKLQLPEFDENMKSLRYMKLDHTAIKELPPSVKYLTSLEYLSLDGCANLIALPSEIHLLKSLYKLHLHGCSKLDMFPQRSSLNFPQESLCSKLTILDLENCNISNADFLKTLSDICTSLFDLNLSGNKFSCLPSLRNFTSLRFLQLRSCKFLRNIPNLPHCLARVDAWDCELLVISPDNIVDLIFRKQDFEFNGSVREVLLMNMNSEIPYLSNQTTESSISVSIQHNPNKRQALVIGVVFNVNGDSGKAKNFIKYKISLNGKSSKDIWKRCPSSKSEYMWLQIIPLTFISSDVNDRRHNIQAWFEISDSDDNKAIVTIRRHGVLVVDVDC